MKPIIPSERSGKVKYAIRDIVPVMKKVAKTKEIIPLNIGDPNRFDFDTPIELKNAVYEAMKNRHNYYCDSSGVTEAIHAIVKHNSQLGIECGEDDVIITLGISEAVNLCVAALLNRDENMLIPAPSYPVYGSYIDLFETRKNFYTLDEENEWGLNIENIEKQINSKTKAIVIINPNNPTGAVYDKEALKEIVNIAGQHNLLIYADEIYDEMILEGEMHHIAALSGEIPVITYNGLSKNFLCPGWRVGWLTITDRENVLDNYKEALLQLTRARLCAVTPEQFAIRPALESSREFQKEVIEKLRKRCELSYKRINEIDGLSLVKPKAAFYAFPKINFHADDKDFVIKLLEETGVVTVFGSGFNMPGHFRIVYLPPEDILNEAYDKIEGFVKAYKCKA